jgi:predicted dehydrogenase
MEERPLRLGYVGAGNLAQAVHLPSFATLPGCRPLALAEARRDLGEQVRALRHPPALQPCYAWAT